MSGHLDLNGDVRPYNPAQAQADVEDEYRDHGAAGERAGILEILRALADEASKYDEAGAYWLELAIAKVGAP